MGTVEMKYLPLNLFLILSLTSLTRQVSPTEKLSPIPSEVPTVTFCELVNNQASYNQKIVRLKVRYRAGFEIAAFENDLKCSPSPRPLIDVDFDGAYRSCTDKKVQKDLSRLMEVRRNKVMEVRRAELTVVGQFNGAKEVVRIGDYVSTPGYGHLGGHPYQFVIKCVERVQKVTKEGA